MAVVDQGYAVSVVSTADIAPGEYDVAAHRQMKLVGLQATDLRLVDGGVRWTVLTDELVVTLAARRFSSAAFCSPNSRTRLSSGSGVVD